MQSFRSSDELGSFGIMITKEGDILVNISEEVMEIIEKEGDGLYEIAGFPETGATTAAEILLSKHVAADKEAIDAICFAEENPPDEGYIKGILPGAAVGRIVHSFYRGNDTNTLLMLVKSMAEFSDVVVIDDFYHALMYKKYNFIRDYMKSLRNVALSHGVKILFVNQIRHVINNSTYQFATDEEYKTLYWEHISSYVDGRFSVTKDDNLDIHVDVKEVKSTAEKTSLENLLDSFI